MKKYIHKLFSVILLFIGIYYIFLGNPFIEKNKNNLYVPEDKDIKLLVKNTLIDFKKGLIEKSMDIFYENSYSGVKNMFTLKEYNENFIELFNDNTQFEEPSLENIKIIEKSILKENNSFTIKGLLINNYKFELHYFYENSKWKPFGIMIYPVMVNIKDIKELENINK